MIDVKFEINDRFWGEGFLVAIPKQLVIDGKQYEIFLNFLIELVDSGNSEYKQKPRSFREVLSGNLKDIVYRFERSLVSVLKDYLQQVFQDEDVALSLHYEKDHFYFEPNIDIPSTIRTYDFKVFIRDGIIKIEEREDLLNQALDEVLDELARSGPIIRFDIRNVSIKDCVEVMADYFRTDEDSVVNLFKIIVDVTSKEDMQSLERLLRMMNQYLIDETPFTGNGFEVIVKGSRVIISVEEIYHRNVQTIEDFMNLILAKL